jgi:hypothetical protein
LETKVDDAKTFEERKDAEFGFAYHPQHEKEILAEIDQMELGFEVVKCQVNQDECQNHATENVGDNLTG